MARGASRESGGSALAERAVGVAWCSTARGAGGGGTWRHAHSSRRDLRLVWFDLEVNGTGPRHRKRNDLIVALLRVSSRSERAIVMRAMS